MIPSKRYQPRWSIQSTGTTRDNFGGKPVKELEYTSYKPKALQTMLQICTSISIKHSLTSIAMIHRLGIVPIGEESILIAVSSPHRQAAWRAGEEALEECKKSVEVWKKEEFGGEEGGVWRANRDGAVGVRVDNKGDGNGEGLDGGGDDVSDVSFGGITEDMVRPFKNILERGHGPVMHPKSWVDVLVQYFIMKIMETERHDWENVRKLRSRVREGMEHVILIEEAKNTAGAPSHDCVDGLRCFQYFNGVDIVSFDIHFEKDTRVGVLTLLKISVWENIAYINGTEPALRIHFQCH
jgi:molybdopterin synthase catalytic subunit